ncbi:putative queuosine precursor transporter [Flavobacterium sp. 9AF]|uniref:queuosine precursor transporter n=1 Tax=Flavobacterium sp. 9AF TaxID=2653142 RepID=UPI0012F3C984|nr:queuosine precursor transporter [Flavobacterium sp. 9AF]VXB14895.1 putative queuosine precursor transporter [Flavobacterium sp. 9AF]
MTTENKFLAQRIYLILTSLFICSLVVSNLIFQKFFYWYPFGNVEFFGAKLFQISVGIIPYPITFLITDIISEIYGKKKANQVVTTGIFASIFSLGIIYIANLAPALENSPVSDALFSKVFGQTALAVIASMLAYLFAQYIDIQVYHFWKKITKGKMLWVRNNFSTMTSQAVDTLCVLLLLCSFNILAWNLFLPLFISGFLFKVIIALLDTPFMYLAVYYFRKKFHLKTNEELNID